MPTPLCSSYPSVYGYSYATKIRSRFVTDRVVYPCRLSARVRANHARKDPSASVRSVAPSAAGCRIRRFWRFVESRRRNGLCQRGRRFALDVRRPKLAKSAARGHSSRSAFPCQIHRVLWRLFQNYRFRNWRGRVQRIRNWVQSRRRNYQHRSASSELYAHNAGSLSNTSRQILYASNRI